MPASAAMAKPDHYRWQRYIYDLTRKYYLFGRDRLIRELKPAPGEHVCEVGCGTARNLILAAKRYPGVHFYGIDASEGMLKTAAQSLARAELGGRVKVAEAWSTDFSGALFGRAGVPFDRLIFSYSLSMMGWRTSLDHALTQVKPGGTIHIVDFGDVGRSKVFKRFLFWWLKEFSVTPCAPEVRAYFAELEKAGRGRMVWRDVMRGYAYRLDFVVKA